MDGNKVDVAVKNSVVTAKISLSGGDAGQYIVRVIRDINLRNDEVVQEVILNYAGISDSDEISFSPKLATDESSTNGYEVSLMKNGDSIWTIADSYPPRLRVTIK